MSYMDSIKKLQEMNRAYDAVHAINERWLEITSPLQQLAERIHSITRLPEGITSAMETAAKMMNSCISETNYSVTAASKLGEALHTLKGISLYEGNNINNMISGAASMLGNIQTMLPETPPWAEAFNNTHFLEQMNEITASHSNFDYIISSLAQPDVLEEMIWEYEQTADVETVTSSEDISEFREDLQNLIVDNRNWQQKIADTVGKWKYKNPVFYFIIVTIILSLAVSISANIISGIITVPKAAVKGEPSASGDVIYNITINQEVTIIEDARYYYKVQFYIEGSDEPIIGWVSKRSIEINDDDTSDGENAIPVILDRESTEPVDTYIINPQSQTPT